MDTPELVGSAMHQLGELEDRSLSDIVHYKGCLVCVLKKVDISSTDPRDQLMDLSYYPTFDWSMGYHPIRPEPTIFVMLSYSWLIPRAYTIISFGSDQYYHLFT